MSETSDAMDAFDELRQFFGWKRSAEILGLSVIYQVRGLTASQLQELGPSNVTAWRLVEDLKKFRMYLNAKGKGHLLDAEPGDELRGVGKLATRVGDSPVS